MVFIQPITSLTISLYFCFCRSPRQVHLQRLYSVNHIFYRFSVILSLFFATSTLSTSLLFGHSFYSSIFPLSTPKHIFYHFAFILPLFIFSSTLIPSLSYNGLFYPFSLFLCLIVHRLLHEAFNSVNHFFSLYLYSCLNPSPLPL